MARSGGPQPPRLLPRDPLTEAADLLVAAVEQHVGHFPAAKLGWTRPVGAVQQAFPMSRLLERFEGRRAFIAQNPRQQARHGIDHHRGGQLSAAQDIIADRDLFVGQVLGHALVHAPVATA